MVPGESARVKFIAECGVKACLLEVSSEKPGNITPTKSFKNTSYSDFVAGSRALRPILNEAATTGASIAARNEAIENADVGRLILDGVEAVKKSHAGGNTHLGILMLFTPLALSAGMCAGLRKGFENLRNMSSIVLEATTTEDALNLYSAINKAEAGGMGSYELDVNDAESMEALKMRNMTLFDVMLLSSEWDDIAAELTGKYRRTFEAESLLENIAMKNTDLTSAITQTFLALLSEYPDTLIARKCGADAAEDVSIAAREALDAGGVLSAEGRQKINEFDAYLRSDGNKLNPGTTADITAAALFVLLLNSSKATNKGQTEIF